MGIRYGVRTDKSLVVLRAHVKALYGVTPQTAHQVAEPELTQVCQHLAHFPTSPAANPHGCWVSFRK